MLYSLSLFNERQEAFFIGLFKSHKKARQEAEHYLSSIPGFRDSVREGPYDLGLG